MRKMIFDRSKLHLAEVKYFDVKHNGIELTDPASLVIVYGSDGHYVNALSPYEEFPTFKRSRESNDYDGMGEYYGTKVIQLTEEASTGACWVLRNRDDFSEKLPEQVTVQELEDYVLESPYYFKDRLDIAKARLRRFEKPFKMSRIVNADKEEYAKYCQFFESRRSDLSREFIKTN